MKEKINAQCNASENENVINRRNVKNEMKKERKSLAKKGKSSEAKIMERKA
jgi:hypothetical protein